MTLSMSGLIAASKRHSNELRRLSKEPVVQDAAITAVLNVARQICQRVETECAANRGSPAQLEVRSKEAYAWFALLSEEVHVQLHLQALRDARMAARDYLVETRQDAEIHLLPMRGLWRATTRKGIVQHQFSELFACADQPFWQAFFGAFAKQDITAARRLLREMANTDTAREWMTAVEECIPEDEAAPQGVVFDLESVFARVNDQFFAGALEKPQIAWTRRTTRRTLGHYQFARDLLTISRSLDSEQVPDFVVDFIMYHELLHKQHGLTQSGTRLYAHTAAFRTDERKFPRYQEATQALAQLARRRRRR